MTLENLGLIGNCQVSALVRNDGAIVWACMPRFDSAPVFGALLDERAGGAFSIAPADGGPGVQRYLTNSNILETVFEGPTGSFRVVDFCPRFIQHDRSFRPAKLFRIVEPLSGTPRIRVRCAPVLGWSKDVPARDAGSHHVSFLGYESEVRLTTDAPISYLDGEPFALSETRRFVFSWGAPVEEPLLPLCDRFFAETLRYWQLWVKRCNIPPLHQEQVIRCALALKLHCFEDTGAIVAAMTTSIPEAPGSGRTWDYRYCWLRDTFYTLDAFRLLGHFEEREQFLHFLLDVASSTPELDLAPLYRIDGKSDLDERIVEHWAGFLGEQPVRVGNAAALHQQYDVFGEMLLAFTPLFLDARFREQASSHVLDLVVRLARKSIAVAGKPDAGIWEYRTDSRPQTFSALMCWAAADRMARIARHHRPSDADEFARAADQIRDEILSRAVHPERNCLVADYGGREVDAALLQAVTLRFLPPEDPRILATIDAVRADLEQDGWVRRYRTDDGFGVPEVSFMLCSFWLVEALAVTGKTAEARDLMRRITRVNAPLGLFSEDVAPKTGRMWGNFPQAYSLVGFIHAAFAVSPRWSEHQY
ncbi:MAG TPA: glycoside hydrolase family 15 protein [Polyangiaceae bacterium]|nr:glycoside hydrolase family 15 protein [Polyangiaceae bacterium]